MRIVDVTGQDSQILFNEIDNKTFDDSLIKNLFRKDVNDYLPSFTYGTDGILYASGTYDTSGYMYVKDATDIITSNNIKAGNIRRILWFDEDKVQVDVITSDYPLETSISVPATAVYCRVTVTKVISNDLMIELGDEVNTYTATEYYAPGKFGVEVADGDLINPHTLYPERLANYEATVNLFDQHTFKEDTYINAANGKELITGGVRCTDFIEISESTDYVLSGANSNTLNAFYNAQKKFISGGVSNQSGFTSPAGAAYFRFTFNTSADINRVQFEQAATATNPVPRAIPTDHGRNVLLRKDYFGKDMDILGDSITQLNQYADKLESALGVVLNNLGISGTPLAGVSANAMWQDVRINSINQNSDIVVVQGGSNDFSLNFVKGNADSTNTNEVAGAMNTIFDKIRRRTSGASLSYDVTLAGTSGTASIKGTKAGDTTVTFNTDLPTTASDYVTANSAAFTAQGITLSSVGAVITMEADFCFGTPLISNETGNLDGSYSVDYTENKKPAQIWFFAPYYYEKLNYIGSSWQSNNTNSNGDTLADYSDIMREVCERNGVIFFDLYNCGINEYNIRTYVEDEGDLIHINDAGGVLYVRYLLNQILELI